jgi:hypothetical protein
MNKQVGVRFKAEGGVQLRNEFKGIGAEADRAFAQMDRGSRIGSAGLQNVGFQVQDFAVQVAGGTDVMRAASQQLPQLLSGFGLLGVALGTAVPLAVLLFQALGVGADKSEILAGQTNALVEATSAYVSAAQAAAVPLEELTKKYGNLADEVRRVRLEQAETARAEAARALQGSIQGFADTGIGDFGSAQIENEAARREQILQRLIAAEAEFRSAVSAGDNQRMIALAAEEQALKSELATLREIGELVTSVGAEYGVSANEAARLAVAAELVRESAGQTLETQIAASEGLRLTLVEVFGSADAANQATGGLVEQLGIALVAMADIASADIASPINAGAAAAGALAQNLASAAAYERLLAQTGQDSGPDSVRSRLGGGGAFAPRVTGAGLPTPIIAVARGGGGGGGGGGGQSAANEAQREAARLFDQTRTAAEKYAIELKNIEQLYGSGDIDADLYARAVEQLGEKFDKTDAQAKKTAANIRQAFDGLFDDPQAALKQLSRQLLQAALYAQLAKSLPNVFGAGGFVPLVANANGNAFQGGRVLRAFANGGVVNGPTMFPMAGGAGLMGEAGPEAILPLTRIGGALGVRSAGNGAGTKVVVNNYSGAQATTRESTGPNGERVVEVMINKAISGGKTDKAFAGRFGGRPQPVKR